MPERVLICYTSGFDKRRASLATTPFIFESCSSYPVAEITNLPSNELFPTLVTGVDPMTHGVWGTRLAQVGAQPGGATLLEALPDTIATTLQCFMHFAGKTYDLAAIPPRRRKEFLITRTKYKRRVKRVEALHMIGGNPTVFDVVGATRSEYFFDSTYRPESSILPRLCNDGNYLEFVELYSLDRHQQWNSDRPEAIESFYSHIDEFLKRLQNRCTARGWTLMLVSDHGHEPINQSHDLQKILSELAFPSKDYSYFIEVSNARFWFRSDAARSAIVSRLRDIPHATVLRHDEMFRYGVPLTDDSYGEIFVYLDPGHIFFPHDFHQPLANLWLGLTDPMQRARLSSPKHRGNHGHLPHFAAERSFAILFDSSYAPRDGGSVLDVAPTVLELLGYVPPAPMSGVSLFSLRKGS